MKSLARMYILWPGISADIEKTVRLCSKCQQVRSAPPLAPLHPWKWPTRPWACLHLDYTGPFQGKNILIAVDAHSKWVEAVCTASTSSTCVIEELRSIFSCFGLPEMVVTDNGTCFVSREFEDFLRSNGIKHTTSAPYHPSSNGLAELAVQTVKQGLKEVKNGSMTSRLAKVLFIYRITPQSTTGLAPAELMLGRRPRTCLDLLKLNTAERVERRQEQQKAQHDLHGQSPTFRIGDPIFLKNFTSLGWLPGKVVETTGPVSFIVLLDDGRRRRCHQDQLRSRVVGEGPPKMSEITVEAEVDSSSSPTELPGEPNLGTPPAEHTPVQPELPDLSKRTRTPIDTNICRYPRRQRKQREMFQPGKD